MYINKKKKITAGLLVMALLCVPAVLAVDAKRSPHIPVAVSEEPAENTGPIEGLSNLSLDIEAKGAVLIDAGTGQILYAQDAERELAPASVTKIMTMLLALEAVESGKISLDDKVTISKRAASMGGSQVFMEEGEVHTLRELLKCIAIVSANDACVAVSEYVAGTEEIFVDRMNERARELGMKNTNFVNTNGLPVAGHRTSAYDIGLMSRELLKHDVVTEWTTTWMDTVEVGREGRTKTEIGLTNTNRLIRTYDGATGLKTGYTAEAGYCLSASATKGDLTLIAVVLGSPSTKVRFAEASRLLDYGFANYDSVVIAKKGDHIGTVTIQKGKTSDVNVIATEDISVLVNKGEKAGVTHEIVLYGNIHAPVSKGHAVGEIVVMQDGVEIGKYPLAAEGDIEKANLLDIYIRMLQSFN